MKTTIDKVIGYSSALFIPVLFASAQPAAADTCDYSITRYSAPMSRTVRTYSVMAPTSTTTTYVSTPAPVVNRVITRPVLIEKPVVSDSVYIEKTIRQPVLIERPAPVMVERTSPAPVVIENKPVKIKKDSHHLINFGVWPLKLKVL